MLYRTVASELINLVGSLRNQLDATHGLGPEEMVTAAAAEIRSFPFSTPYRLHVESTIVAALVMARASHKSTNQPTNWELTNSMPTDDRCTKPTVKPQAHTVHALSYVHAFSALTDACTVCGTVDVRHPHRRLRHLPPTPSLATPQQSPLGSLLPSR